MRHYAEAAAFAPPSSVRRKTRAHGDDDVEPPPRRAAKGDNDRVEVAGAFAHAMLAMAKRGRGREALGMWVDMKALCLPPSRACYRALFHALRAAGGASGRPMEPREAATAAVREAVAAATGSEAEEAGMSPEGARALRMSLEAGTMADNSFLVGARVEKAFLTQEGS